MALTSHGHQIPGSPVSVQPASAARCGGASLCPQCQKDMQEYWEVKRLPEDPPSRALHIVRDHVNKEHFGNARFEVHLVFFAYILRGWKATVSTDLPDQKYYEVTHDVRNECTYLDEYTKTANITLNY